MKQHFKSEISLILSLARYAVGRQWSIIPITSLGIASSLLELCAMASIIPLGTLAGGAEIDPASFWYKFPLFFGFTADGKFYAALFTLLMFLRSVTMVVSHTLNQFIMRGLIAHFSSRALDSFVHHLSFQDVQKHQIGHFLALAGDEANRAAQIITALMKLLPFAVMFLLYFAVVFYHSPTGGVVITLASATILWLMGDIFRKTRRLGQRQQEESRALNSHFVDSLNGLRTVRGFTAEEFVSSRYDQMIRGYARTSLAIDSLGAVASNAPSMLLMIGLFLACIMFADPTWLEMNMAVLLAGAMLVLRLLPLANQALDITMKLTADLKATRNISEMLAVIQARKDADPLPAFDEPVRRIAFENVTFRYGDDLAPVLQSLNLTFEAGKSYAIVGPSGSGKSSLVDLLMKFFRPQTGVIRVNDRDISTISDASLRSHIVLAEQNTRIFYDTVQHNIEFGRPTSRERAREAMALVGLDAMLLALPSGLDTMLDYQGSNVSGGQRQRIGLARAILRSGDVMILDESTNALDAELRARILDGLLARFKDRILIFVTHDEYVMARVDQVINLAPVTEDSPRLQASSR